MHEARINQYFCLKAGGLFFGILHVHIFIQQNILGAMNLLWSKLLGGGWQLISKTLAGKFNKWV